MAKIICPHCRAAKAISQPKAGRFSLSCKQCQEKFQIVISQQADGEFLIRTAQDIGNPAAPKQPVPAKPEGKPEGKGGRGRPDAVTHLTASSKPAERSPSFDAMADTRVVSQEKTRIEHTRADQARLHSADSDDFAIRGKNAQQHTQGSNASAPEIGKNLGPYRLLKLLGQGGMGSVYLAKQMSLDRNVALKVVREDVSHRPGILARFTREAYAAAQLVHPNVVQIYDMGDDRGHCFFSMEWVQGSSLSDVAGNDKKLDPQQAASYILHAARGLQCAHNAGMVHRDIKPANLLVDHSGIVKVADLGLVKVPDETEIEDQQEIAASSALSASRDLTRFGSAVGTPYYMAPEQAKNAVNVDHRADIYSLGCTFYVLLTGKRPFNGKSVEEVVSKHSSEALVLPTQVVARVPERLSAIVKRMMEKLPADRYQNCGELIKDLETFLGISNAIEFTPAEADADRLENSVKRFNAVGLAKARGLFPVSLVLGSLLLAAITLFLSWRWACGFLLLPIAAWTSYFVISGYLEEGNLFGRLREYIFHSGWVSWLKCLAITALLLLAAITIGLSLPVLVLGGLGVGLGVGYYFLIHKSIQRARVSAVDDSKQLTKTLRLKGMDEPTIQLFFAKYAGDHWEEFFENLFGYPAKIRIRNELAKSELGKRRPRFWAWRDRIHDRLVAQIDALTTEKEKRHLQKIEQAGLQAQGVSATQARQQSLQMADALVDHGDSIRDTYLRPGATVNPEVQRQQQRSKVKAMLAEARSGKYAAAKTPLQRFDPVLNRTFGSFARFLAGCLLVLGCALWARQNGLLEAIATTAQNASSAITDRGGIEAISKEGLVSAGETAQQALAESLSQDSTPLQIPVLGSLFFWNFNALIAGLILLVSSLFFGWRMAVFAFPAAALTLWGAGFGLPQLFAVASLDVSSAIAGSVLLIVGMMLGRSDD